MSRSWPCVTRPTAAPTSWRGRASILSASETRAGRVREVASWRAGIRAVATLHRRRPVDLVHGMWADEAGAVATLAARWIGRPSIVSVMGGEFVAMPEIGYGAALGRGGRSSVRVSLRAADLISVPSSLIDGMVRPLVRDPDERLVALPLGVDTEVFRPVAHPPSTPTVLFAGSLAPVKDPETAIRAFAAVAAAMESARMVIAGFGGHARQPRSTRQAARRRGSSQVPGPGSPQANG